MTFLFPILNKAIGGDTCFYIFSGFCGFGIFFLFFCLPESSGELNQNAFATVEQKLAAEADKLAKAKEKSVFV